MTASSAVSLCMKYCTYTQLKHGNVKSFIACLFEYDKDLRELRSWWDSHVPDRIMVSLLLLSVLLVPTL